MTSALYFVFLSSASRDDKTHPLCFLFALLGIDTEFGLEINAYKSGYMCKAEAVVNMKEEEHKQGKHPLLSIKSLCLLTLLLLCWMPTRADSGDSHSENADSLSEDLPNLHALYQQEHNWFGASDWLQVQVKQQQVNLPVYAWITNLVPPRLWGTNLYQVCRACFLGRAADGAQDYLRTQHAWTEALHEHLQEARQLTKRAWWSNANQRAQGFLHRLYHERGILSTVIVALTWLPYTAITEAVIEPMLIGPLHTICPLFQVAYFGTLNFTHTLYRNLRHSFTFGNDVLTLPSRVKLTPSGWQRFPSGTWQIAGEEVRSKDIKQDIAAELNDALLVRVLASPLRPVIAATLLNERTSPPSNTEEMWQSIQHELTHTELLRRIYFVEMTIAAARALIDLHATHLNARLRDGTLAAENYRQLQGQLGMLHRDVFTLELHLKKLIVITQALNNSHNDMVSVNFQQPAKLTQQALQALLTDLQRIFQLQTSEDVLLTRYIAKFTENDFISNVTTKK